MELKGGLTLPHTSTNGYMFSSLTKDGRLGIRLSKEEYVAFIKKYKAVPFENYGANIKEHVEVPEALLRKPKELGKWLAKSYTYTNALRPKKQEGQSGLKSRRSDLFGGSCLPPFHAAIV